MSAQSTVRPRPKHLPDFLNPPVVETVLSVQFETSPPMNAVHLGLLWKEYQASFPKTEIRPTLDPVIERFPEERSTRAGLKLQTLHNLPVPRFWFISVQGNEMIQVQSDRFIKNWRKGDNEETYPRYDDTIRPNFDRDYGIFLAFLERNQIGPPSVNQCEVTYVNHILAGEGWKHYSELEKIFTFWRSPDLAPPGEIEDLRLHARFVIPDEVKKAIGRLHVDLQPAVRTSDSHPMYVLNLTARGQISDGLDFFDVGREWIVQTFHRLTTDSMHSVWRVRNNAESRNR